MHSGIHSSTFQAFVTKLAAFVLGALCICLPHAAIADAGLERMFIWDEANRSMAAADTPEDFMAAAGKYHQLLERGSFNGPILYNIGTALLKAGKYDDAQRFLLRAERYTGYDPDIGRNLIIAMARGDKKSVPSMPWYRFPLFWHYGLPGSVRMAVAIGAFFLFWIALAMKLTGAERAGKTLLVLSIAALALFGSSAVTTMHQEKSADSRLLLHEISALPARPQNRTGTNQINQ